MNSKRKLYLAGRYSRRLELLERADRLRELGYEITSRWLQGDHEGGYEDDTDWTRYACEDLTDVFEADAMICFTEGREDVPGKARGGRHVEAGIAIGLSMAIFVVGPCENVFYHLPGVTQCDTWEQMESMFDDSKTQGGRGA